MPSGVGGRFVATTGQLTGMRGVYLVASELCRIGLTASPTSRSAIGADILVTDQRCQKTFSVQVKTNARTFSFWLLNKKSKEMVSPTLIYVLVNIRPRSPKKDKEEVEYFVVPSTVIAQKMKTDVQGPKKTEWHSIYRSQVEEYKDCWDMFVTKPQILIVGAHGAVGSHSLLKLYGNENLSVLILPSELESFRKDRFMHEDEWHPSDRTFISSDTCVVGGPCSAGKVAVYTTETISAGFFKPGGVAVIASKIFHYDSVIETLKPVLNGDTLIFELANGLKPEVTLERKCRERDVWNPVIRGVVMGGTHNTFDGNAWGVHSGIASFVIGHWERGHSAEFQCQLETIAGLYPSDRFRVEPRYGNDFRTLSFDKILANLVNPISAFTGCITVEYVTDDLPRGIITKCFNQGIDVGMALGLALADREDVIRRKLEMYEKAGQAAKAHLPSMGQDALRAALNRTPLYHENEHIGVAVVKEGLEAKTPFHASSIDDFNRLLDLVTEHYGRLYARDKDEAATFLIGLMMRNRYSLGLEPNNKPLYEQFDGLEDIETGAKVDYSGLRRIRDIDEAASVFAENFRGLLRK